MAHDTVYGFCENKCKVEVSPKTDTDAVKSRVSTLEGRVANGTNSISTKGLTNSGNLTNTGTITSTGQIVANGGVKGNLTGNVTGQLTNNGTVVTSAPYSYNNITLGTIPIPPNSSSPNKSNLYSLGTNYYYSKSTISAVPATVSTLWGTYSMTRPSVSVTYTFTLGHDLYFHAYFNGTKVFGQRCVEDVSYTFTVSYDTSKTNTLEFFLQSSTYGWTIGISGNISNLYLKKT